MKPLSTINLETFRLAVECSSNHIIITDVQGKIIYANRAVEKITGYSQQEIIGQTPKLWGGLMEEAYYEQLWHTISVKHQAYYGQVKNKRKNGEIYYASVYISPVQNEQGEYIGFIGTEEDRTQEHLVDQAKTEFVSLASHQLRTPLSTINWYTEMLLNGDAGEINVEQKKYLNEIYQASQHMSALVNDLLNVSRIELGTFVIEPQPINPIETMLSVLSEVKPLLEKNQIQLLTNYDPTLTQYIADAKLLRIIFQNLITNAVKYNRYNGVVNIELNWQEKGANIVNYQLPEDSLLFSVADNGIGIPQTQQNKIFTKLFRADNAQKVDSGGTGLGLYLTQGIVENSGGKILFTSEEGKGTKFYVILPKTGMQKKSGLKTLQLI
jgi:PAS domain S-box-containing protein